MSEAEALPPPPKQVATLPRRVVFRKVGEYAAAGALGGVLTRLATGSGMSAEASVSEPTDPRAELIKTAAAGLTIAEYTPPFQEQRPVVAFSQEQFSLKRPATAAEVIAEAPTDLEQVIKMIEAQQDNPAINPDLSYLDWFQHAPNEPYFKPPTLLTLVKNALKDIRDGRVILTTEGKEYAASTHSEFFVHEKIPHLGKSFIHFSTERLQRDRYPSVDKQDEQVGLSNLNALVLLMYEYSNRLHTIGDLVYLKDQGVFKQFPPQGAADIHTAMKMYHDIRFEEGHRRSREQCHFQMMFHRSLASLAGDPNGRVVGLERNEDWRQYQLFTAGLNGDTKANLLLQQHLSVGANY